MALGPPSARPPPPGGHPRPVGRRLPAPPGGKPSPSRSPGRGPAPALPSRDDLTKAWGDTVLTQLSRPAKVFLAGGRFVEVAKGAAVFGLPGEGLLAHASNFQAEAEGALAAHFGQAVPLRLVLDKAPAPVPGPPVLPGAPRRRTTWTR